MRVSSIKRKSPRALQSFILYGLTLLIALGLKYHYSRSGSDDLLWILSPTAGLVEYFSGTPFQNEINTGYVNHERRIIIAPSCAGINFMIIVFCMTAFSGLNSLAGVRIRSLWLIFSLMIAYGLTLGVNTLRIITSIVVYETHFFLGSISMDQIHRIQGILIYFISLYLFYFILQKVLDMIQYPPKENRYRLLNKTNHGLFKRT
jgi:exosortase K